MGSGNKHVSLHATSRLPHHLVMAMPRPTNRLRKLRGRTIGKFTALNPEGWTPSGYPLWRLRCVCGVEVLRSQAGFLNGRISVCPGCQPEPKTLVGSANPRWLGAGSIPGHYWGQVKRHARDKGRELSVTIKEAWKVFQEQGGRCAHSGEPLHFSPTARRDTEGTASLDRIDSSKGYVPGNVQWVHKTVNRIKHNLSDEEFVSWCRRVAANSKVQL